MPSVTSSGGRGGRVAQAPGGGADVVGRRRVVAGQRDDVVHVAAAEALVRGAAPAPRSRPCPAARRACVIAGADRAARERRRRRGRARCRRRPATRPASAAAASARDRGRAPTSPSRRRRPRRGRDPARCRSRASAPSMNTAHERDAALGERVEAVGQVGLRERRRRAERRVARPRARASRQTSRSAAAPSAREAGEADELAGGLVGRDQPLADARDASRRRRRRRRARARPRSPGAACVLRRRRASGDRRPAPIGAGAAARRRACSGANTMSEYENRKPSAISPSA